MNDKTKANAQIWITFQATITNKFLFKIKNEDNDNTLRFGNEDLLSTLEKLQIQIKYNSNRVIDYQEQSDSLLWLKTTLATLSNQETTVQLRYFFANENWKWLNKYTKTLQFFAQWRRNISKERGFKQRYTDYKQQNSWIELKRMDTKTKTEEQCLVWSAHLQQSELEM